MFWGWGRQDGYDEGDARGKSMSGILNLDDASDGGVRRRPPAADSPPLSGDEMGDEGIMVMGTVETEESTLEKIRNSHGNDTGDTNANSGAIENLEEKEDQTNVGGKGHGQAARGRQGASEGSGTGEGIPSPSSFPIPNPLELLRNRQDRHVSRAWSASPSSANLVRRHRIAHALERQHDPVAFRADGSAGGRDDDGNRSLVSREGGTGDDPSPVLSRLVVDSSGEGSAQQERGTGERSGDDVDGLDRGFVKSSSSGNIRHRETPLSRRNGIEGKRNFESGSTRAEILGSDGSRSHLWASNEALWGVGVAADDDWPPPIQHRRRRYILKHSYIHVIMGRGGCYLIEFPLQPISKIQPVVTEWKAMRKQEKMHQ